MLSEVRNHGTESHQIAAASTRIPDLRFMPESVELLRLKWFSFIKLHVCTAKIEWLGPSLCEPIRTEMTRSGPMELLIIRQILQPHELEACRRRWALAR